MTETPRLFDLLPALYRNRDAAPGSGGALLALTRVLDDARAGLRADVDRLYRDWFVETCDPSILPLIGDLVGLAPFERQARDLRAIVADTVAFRGCNDGVAAIAKRLSALAGWPVRLVRGSEPGEVRAEVWVDEAFAFFRAAPRPAAEAGLPGCYHFDALGRDVQLIDPPSAASPGFDAPTALTRDSPSDALSRAVSIYVGAEARTPLPPDAVVAGDLSRWRAAAAARQGVRAVVDPALGRLALLDAPAPAAVAVGYTRAAAARSGGGPYERDRTSPPRDAWLAHVHGSVPPSAARLRDRPPAFPTLRAALEAFAAVPGPGVIRILDSGRYDVADLDVGAPAQGGLPCPDGRHLVVEAISGEAPCLTGAITFRGTGSGLRATLAGLWIDGTVRLAGPVSLSLRHCTVHPAAVWRSQRPEIPAVVAAAGPGPVRVTLRHCLAGSLHLSDETRLLVLDSVVDGARSGRAITGKPSGHVARSSLMGSAAFSDLESDDAVFDGRVDVGDPGSGECRTSYVPPGSRTPRRTGCVPETSSIRPVWDSLTWGAPGYARLSAETDPLILRGGRDGREMGAQAGLDRQRRLDLANAGLSRYLPPGVPSSSKVVSSG